MRVRAEDAAVRWRKPHLRTPGYIFGLVGTVERDCVVRAPGAPALCARGVAWRGVNTWLAFRRCVWLLGRAAPAMPVHAGFRVQPCCMHGGAAEPLCVQTRSGH